MKTKSHLRFPTYTPTYFLLTESTPQLAMSSPPVDLGSASARFLQCVVCQDLLSGQVTQCKNGHNICSSHSLQSLQGKCPTCRIKFSAGSSRNRLAEEMVKQERERQEQQRSTPSILTPSVSAPSIPLNPSPIVPSNSRQTQIRTPNANNRDETISCRYLKDGCDTIILAPTAIRHHEQNCYFRWATAKS